MRSNPDQQLLALKNKFGTNLDWIKVEVPMTYYQVKKYFGPECEEYDHLCSCCIAWEQFHKNNQVVSFYLERNDILNNLDNQIKDKS